MTRRIEFVNDSGAPWALSGLGNREVPALSSLDLTNEVTDVALTEAIQNAISPLIFDAERYLKINDIAWSADRSTNYGSQSRAANTIIVVKDGSGDYTTIKSALADIGVGLPSASTSNRYLVKVKTSADLTDSDYHEDNPIIFPDYVSLKFESRHEATRIICNNVGQHGVVVGSDSDLVGVQVQGASGAGMAAYYIPAGKQDVDLHDCKYRDCDFGVLNESGVVAERIRVQEFSVMGGTSSTAVKSGVGSGTHVLGLYVSPGAVVTSEIVADGVGAEVNLNAVDLESGTVTNGLYALNGGVIYVNGVRVGAAVNGVRIGSGGGTINGSGLTIDPASVWDVLIDDASGKFLVDGGKWRKAYMSCFAGSLCVTSFLDDSLPGDEAKVVLAELHVGRFDAGRAAAFGEGDSYVFDMMVHQYDVSAPSGSRFTDVTAAAKSIVGSSFGFPTGAAIGDGLVIGVPRKFWGIKSSVITALVHGGGGSIVWEYWDGAAWQAFNVMETDSDAPYASYADYVFEQTGSFQIRFDDAIDTPWTADDSVLDEIPNYGSNHFVVRARIATAALVTPASFEQFKVHPSRLESNVDGVLEFFGKARRRVLIPFDLGVLYQGGAVAPGGKTINWSPSITGAFGDDRLIASYATGLFKMVSASTVLPTWVDSSVALKFRIAWFPESNMLATSVIFDITAGIAKDGDIVDTSTLAETTVQETVSGVLANVRKVTTFASTIPIPKMVGSAGDELFIAVRRRGDLGGDDFGDSIVMTSIGVYAAKWIEGEAL